jgi:BlaI family transcriptional regulator, penicillinase repressor
MQKLAKREEQIMQIVWKLEKAFIKDIIEELPEPKPHYNTIATMVKILKDKGFLTDEKFGNTFQYCPQVSLEEYRKLDVENIKQKYFDNSFKTMITHFAKEENMSDAEIDEIVKIIKSGKSSKP